ncbi:MAG: redoxin domain-containing protein [Dehalococcoidia bacterium]
MVDGVDMEVAAEAAALTEREREIARLLGQGLTNAAIAERLGITFATAKWHTSQVLSKLGAGRREEVAGRLIALAEDLSARRKAEARGLRGFGWLAVAKGLGFTAVALPLAAISVAGVLVLRNGGVEDSGPPALEASITEVEPTPAARIPNIIGPTPQAHTCDWQEGQRHINDGPLNHSGCDFGGVNFGSVMWNDANLSGANLSGAVFEGATLFGANLSGADVRDAWFITSVMAPNFNGADLTGAHFTDSIVGGSYLNATCPDGSTTDTNNYSCLGRPGLANLPDSRSMSDALALKGLPARWTSFADARNPGTEIDLSAFNGRRVVLWWFANWCDACRAQVPKVQEFAELFPETVFIALSLDEAPEFALQFAEATGLTIPIGMDSQFKASRAYKIIGARISVTIGPDGLIEGYDAVDPY